MGCKCNGKCTMAVLGDTKTYRGYVISKTFHGIGISKGGRHVGWAESACVAKEIIDRLGLSRLFKSPIVKEVI